MTFSQILGHERQKDILRRALSSGRLAHAYMFEGPEGIGKRLMALALVRALFCLHGTGCGDCTACRKVDHNNHPDLVTVEPDGASIKIEQVRSLQKELVYKPLEAPRRVCLIDGGDLMPTAAANALLKTLEEPPGNALIIVLTSRPEVVLETIRSRCQRLPFTRLPQQQLKKVLMERLDIDERQGHILAALSEGSFKMALGKNRTLFLEERPRILKAVTALSTGAVLPLLELAEQLAADKEQIGDILELLQVFYRDLFLFRQGRPEEEMVNIDLLEKIHRVSATQSLTGLTRKIEAIAAARYHLDRNVNRQLTMEVLLLHLAA